MAVRPSAAALVTRGALYTYLRPRLAQDAKPHCMAMIERAVSGVTSRNYGNQQPKIVNALRRFTQGRLAQDNGIEDLASLLSALSPAVQQADQAPGLGQIATNPSGSAGGGMVTPAPDQGGSTHDIVAKIKAY